MLLSPFVHSCLLLSFALAVQIGCKGIAAAVVRAHVHCPPTMLSRLVLTIALLNLLGTAPVHAHQSLSLPLPLSRDVACRISSNSNCRPPCPRTKLRLDVNPNNPSLTVRRGSTVTFHTLKNNHIGGFSRWSLVPLYQKYNSAAHNRLAFLYTCADPRPTSCRSATRRRDCNYDRNNLFFRHSVRIPPVYPDGVYVLGWVWYGGGARWGSFGDYYDCTYIRIAGGPLANSYRPTFAPGPAISRVGSRCRATVDRVGICWREPCPGGGRFTRPLKPWQFSQGRKPALLTPQLFRNPYNAKRKRRRSPRVKTLSIRSADVPSKVYAAAARPRLLHLWITRRMRTTVTCEVGGMVKEVTFYINGVKGRTDRDRPYSIAGDWVEYRSRKVRYAPWAYRMNNRFSTVSCVAKGFDGTESWRTIQLSTTF